VKFKEIISEMRCEILKPFYKRVGYVTLTSHEVIFFEEMYNHVASAANNDSQSSDNIFFFKHTLPTDSLYYKILPLSDLRELQRRRWLGRKTALEVFLMNGKALLLNFPTTEDREQFAKKVLRQRNSRCSNLKYYDTLDPRRILKKRELTERWMQWKLSNFEYVTLLNQLSGRSYNDLSQYPVFPWLLSDFQTQ
jgi:Beige/BEACH domain/PH domain associated with Beige/BEACH